MVSIKKFIQTGFFAVFIANSLFGVGHETYIKNIIQADPKVIHLIGETHNNPEDIKRKAVLKKLAEERKIILGLEALSEEVGIDVNATIFGLENTAVNYLATAINNLVAFYHHVGYKKMVALHITSEAYNKIFGSPEYAMFLALQDIWSYVDRAVLENKDPDETAFFQKQLQSNRVLNELITYLKDALTIEPPGRIYAQNIGDNQLENNFFDNLSTAPYAGDWFFLLDRVVFYRIREQAVFLSRDYLQRIDRLHRGGFLGIFSDLRELYPDLIAVANLSEFKLVESRFQILIDLNRLLKLELRNEIFLRNIIQAYQNKAHLNKPFFVVVGAAHIPALKQDLEKQSFQVVQLSRDESAQISTSPHEDL